MVAHTLEHTNKYTKTCREQDRKHLGLLMLMLCIYMQSNLSFDHRRNIDKLHLVGK